MRETIGKSRTTTLTTCRPSRTADPARRRLRVGRLVVLAAALLASPVLFAPGVLAHHFTGEVQLWVSTLDFRDSPGGVVVAVKLIERESGESVSGFGVRVTATGGGDRVGPVELQESEFAVYTGTLQLRPGSWEILATAHQGTSALPAIESAHRKTLQIDAAGQVVVPGSGSGGTTILATVLPICAVVLVLAVVLRRRRLALYDRTEDGGTEDGGAGDGGAEDGEVPAPPTAGGDPARDPVSR